MGHGIESICNLKVVNNVRHLRDCNASSEVAQAKGNRMEALAFRVQQLQDTRFRNNSQRNRRADDINNDLGLVIDEVLNPAA